MKKNIDLLAREQVIRMVGVNPRTCMKCGKCTATCPSFEEMEYHPHQFISMVEAGRVEELANSGGIYNCLACMACLERCPRGVEPAKFDHRREAPAQAGPHRSKAIRKNTRLRENEQKPLDAR